MKYLLTVTIFFLFNGFSASAEWREFTPISVSALMSPPKPGGFPSILITIVVRNSDGEELIFSGGGYPASMQVNELLAVLNLEMKKGDSARIWIDSSPVPDDTPDAHYPRRPYRIHAVEVRGYRWDKRYFGG